MDDAERKRKMEQIEELRQRRRWRGQQPDNEGGYLARYKVRCETAADFLRFVAAANANDFYVADFYIPAGPQMDWVIGFDSNATVVMLREVLAGLSDCHVMLETVAHLAEYTGKR